MNWQGALSGRFSLHGLTKAPGTITIPGNENTRLRRNSGRSTLDKRYGNPSNNWKIPVNPLSEAFKLYPTLYVFVRTYFSSVYFKVYNFQNICFIQRTVQNNLHTGSTRPEISINRRGENLIKIRRDRNLWNFIVTFHTDMMYITLEAFLWNKNRFTRL